jgi:hypothetical protein
MGFSVRSLGSHSVSNLALRIQQIKQIHRDGARSLFTIFAHPDERGPVGGVLKRKNDEAGKLESAGF